MRTKFGHVPLAWGGEIPHSPILRELGMGPFQHWIQILNSHDL